MNQKMSTILTVKCICWSQVEEHSKLNSTPCFTTIATSMTHNKWTVRVWLESVSEVTIMHDTNQQTRSSQLNAGCRTMYRTQHAGMRREAVVFLLLRAASTDKLKLVRLFTCLHQSVMTTLTRKSWATIYFWPLLILQFNKELCIIR